MATMRILTFSNGLRKTILGFLIGQINILHRHAHSRCSDDFDAEDLIGGEYKVTEVLTVK